MKKVCFKVLLVLLISCLFFVSCDSDTPTAASSEPVNTVTQSLMELKAGETLVLENIGEETEINLSGFSLADGVYIQILDSKGKAAKAINKIDTKDLYQRNDGSIIPIPGEDGTVNFKGKDIGIGNGNKISVNKLPNLNTDLMISAEEYKNTDVEIAEEYYFVDLRKLEKSGLDLNDVVLLETGAGAHGIRYLHKEALEWNTSGVMNLNRYKQSGFAINMFLGLHKNGNNRMKIHILNPMDVTATNESSAHDIDSECIVIRVNKGFSGKKLVIKFDSSVSSDFIKAVALTSSTHDIKTRLNDGKNRETTIVPEYDLVNKTITYHLGQFDKAFMFNLNWEDVTYGDDKHYEPGTAHVYLSDDDWNINSFNNISSSVTSNNNTEVPLVSGKIVTWAFKSDSKYPIYVEKTFGSENTRIHFHDNFGGSGFGHIREFLFSTDESVSYSNATLYTGYIVIDCTNLAADGVVTLVNAENYSIDCEHVEFSDGYYRCMAANCENPACMEKYSLNFISACYKSIFNGTYFDAEHTEFGMFKDITHTDNGFVIGSILSLPKHNTNGSDQFGRRSEKYFLTNDTSKWISFSLQAIIQEDSPEHEGKKLVYDVYWYNMPDPNSPTRVTYALQHEWEFKDNTRTVVQCNRCHAERAVTSIMLSHAERKGFKVYLNVPAFILVPATGESFVFTVPPVDPIEFEPFNNGITEDVPVYVFAINSNIQLNVQMISGPNPSVYSVTNN